MEDDGVCPTLYFWLHDVSVEDALLLSVRGLEFSEKLVDGQYYSSMSNSRLNPSLYILTPEDSINPAFFCGGALGYKLVLVTEGQVVIAHHKTGWTRLKHQMWSCAKYERGGRWEFAPKDKNVRLIYPAPVGFEAFMAHALACAQPEKELEQQSIGDENGEIDALIREWARGQDNEHDDELDVPF